MKIISCNLGNKQSILFRGKEVETGIFKSPVREGIFLMKEGVRGDAVIDRRWHGGTDKAVYLYSSDHYDYWKKLYPGLDWDWGMFGENLTIEGMDESRLFSGARYRVNSEVIIEITTPREPCYKLGHKFGTPKVIKQFMNQPFPGVYARVIQGGWVRPRDGLEPVQEGSRGLSIAEQYLTKMRHKQVTPQK